MENLPNTNLFNSKFYSLDFLKYKIFFYIAILIILLIISYFIFFTAPNNFPAGTILNIKDKSSLRYISKYLEENNIIRSRVVFETVIITLGGEKYVVAGDYFFEKKISVFEVAKRLVNGERHLAPIKITIPEGFKLIEMSKIFVSKLTNFNVDNFITLGKEKEGYLFPDTYFFLTTDNEESVLRSMSDNFQKKIEPLKSQISLFNKTEKEIITMASIIEEESKGDADREFISGILWRRLSINMPLQVDADPNTYKEKGLPKNPISNPGLKSIKAAISPKSSSYLYYLHDKYGNIHYAKTFSEHKSNIQKYLKN